MSRIKGIASACGRVVGLGWLVGPIFAKELRVSSRRKRNYALWFAYVSVLALMVAVVWFNAVRPRYWSPARIIAWMSQAGKEMSVAIVVAQFALAQLAAILLMSNAFSEEVSRRTLGALMTTPMTSLQIVMGKLLSGMVQLLILLAVSLPVLSLIRLLGGVPWDYVVAATCITFATTLHVGALALLCSLFTRRALVAIMLTIVTLGVVYVLVPFLMHEAADFNTWQQEQQFTFVLGYVHPPISLAMLTETMMSPGPSRSAWTGWPVGCAVTLTMTAGLLALCVAIMRSVTLAHLSGRVRAPRPTVLQPAGAPASGRLRGRRMRRIHGSPVLWRELRGGLRRLSLPAKIGAALTLGALLISYGIVAADDDFDRPETHAAYVAVYVALGMLIAGVLAASSITSEKESRSLVILAATPLTDQSIIWGKLTGAMWRTWPIWAMLGAHMLVFTISGVMSVETWLFASMLVVSMVFVCAAAGVFCSARFRRTTTAVVMVFVLAIVSWVVIPAAIVLGASLLESGPGERWTEDTAGWVANLNPLVQAAVIGQGPEDSSYYYWNRAWMSNAAKYRWPSGRRSFGETGEWVASSMALYCLLGVFYFLRARWHVRRRIFA